MHLLQDNASMRVKQFMHRPGLDPIDDPEVNRVKISDGEITAIGVATGALSDIYRCNDEHGITFRSRLSSEFTPVFMPALSESSRMLQMIQASRYNDNILANLAGNGTNLGQKMRLAHLRDVQDTVENSEMPNGQGGVVRPGYAQMNSTGGDAGARANAMRPIRDRIQEAARRHARSRARGAQNWEAYKGLGGTPNDGHGEMRTIEAAEDGELCATKDITNGGQNLALPDGSNFSFDAKDGGLPAAGSVAVTGEPTPAKVQEARAEMRSHQPGVQLNSMPAESKQAIQAMQESNSEGGSTGNAGQNGPQSIQGGSSAAPERSTDSLPSGVSSSDAEKAASGNQVARATLASGVIEAHRPVIPSQKVIDSLADDPANLKNTAGAMQETPSQQPSDPPRVMAARDALPPATSPPTATTNGLGRAGFIDKLRSMGLSYAASPNEGSTIKRVSEDLRLLAEKHKHHLLDNQYETLMSLTAQINDLSASSRKKANAVKSLRQFLSFL
jgi:hypothetical protein